MDRGFVVERRVDAVLPKCGAAHFLDQFLGQEKAHLDRRGAIHGSAVFADMQQPDDDKSRIITGTDGDRTVLPRHSVRSRTMFGHQRWAV
jgi:hypothetical protein